MLASQSYKDTIIVNIAAKTHARRKTMVDHLTLVNRTQLLLESSGQRPHGTQGLNDNWNIFMAMVSTWHSFLLLPGWLQLLLHWLQGQTKRVQIKVSGHIKSHTCKIAILSRYYLNAVRMLSCQFVAYGLFSHISD